MPKHNSTSELTSHQAVLLSMLKELDSVCRKNGIHYMLFAGTALGAVRHGGFIPWDDDIDVIMLRSDYERFFRTAAGDFDKDRYYVQEEYSAHWPMYFSKLRLNSTTCMEKYHPKDRKMHQGVYIDIFPCDNLSGNAVVRRLQFLASKVVIAKALYARGYETDSILKKCFMQLCRLLPRKPLWRFCVRRRDSRSEWVHTFFGCGTKCEKNIFPREWFEKTADVPFEDGVFPVTVNYGELLTKLYGDYMTLPAPEERKCKEHVAILDLERPYTEHLSEQEAIVFDSYTRSIR